MIIPSIPLLLYYILFTRNIQSRIKVFWGPRLDTIVGPHIHPTLPSSSDPINLTGVWGITTEKVWNCKCHMRVSEAQPGKNFGGENWGQSRNLWRKVPENWGQSPNREREGKIEIWGGSSTSHSPENLWKFKLETLQAIWYSLNNILYLFSLLLFFL